jgi:hypothetical protein
VQHELDESKETIKKLVEALDKLNKHHTIFCSRINLSKCSEVENEVDEALKLAGGNECSQPLKNQNV